MKFGTMGVLKHVGAVIGGDPLAALMADNPQKQFQMIHAFVYAGLVCAGEKITIEDADVFTQELTFDEGALVTRTATEAMLGGNGKAGEKEAQGIAENA